MADYDIPSAGPSIISKIYTSLNESHETDILKGLYIHHVQCLAFYICQDSCKMFAALLFRVFGRFIEATY